MVCVWCQGVGCRENHKSAAEAAPLEGDIMQRPWIAGRTGGRSAAWSARWPGMAPGTVPAPGTALPAAAAAG